MGEDKDALLYCVTIVWRQPSTTYHDVFDLLKAGMRLFSNRGSFACYFELLAKLLFLLLLILSSLKFEIRNKLYSTDTLQFSLYFCLF